MRLPQILNDAQRKTLGNSFFENPLAALDLQIFNMDSKCVETWNGYTWIKACAPATPPPLPIDYVDVCDDGTKWATCNLDMPGNFALKPEYAGMLYQWNKLTGWLATGSVSGWDNSYTTSSTWTTQNDPCPDGWRVPIIEKFIFLLACGSIWTTRNDVDGVLFGNAPNQIFLPAVGWRFSIDGTLNMANEHGNYWSSTEYDSTNAFILYFGHQVRW